MEKEIGFYNHLFCNSSFAAWGGTFKENNWRVIKSDCLCGLDGNSLSQFPSVVIVSPRIPSNDNLKYSSLDESEKREREYCLGRLRLEIERFPEKSFLVELYDDSQEKMKALIGEHPNLKYFDTRQTIKVEHEGIVYSFSQFDLMMKKLLNSAPLKTSRNTLLDSVLSILKPKSLDMLKGIEVAV